jgi:hypothetical protein
MRTVARTTAALLEPIRPAVDDNTDDDDDDDDDDEDDDKVGVVCGGGLRQAGQEAKKGTRTPPSYLGRARSKSVRRVSPTQVNNRPSRANPLSLSHPSPLPPLSAPLQKGLPKTPPLSPRKTTSEASSMPRDCSAPTMAPTPESTWAKHGSGRGNGQRIIKILI